MQGKSSIVKLKKDHHTGGLVIKKSPFLENFEPILKPVPSFRFPKTPARIAFSCSALQVDGKGKFNGGVGAG